MAMYDEIGTITLGGVAHQVEALDLDRLQRAIPMLVEHYAAVKDGVLAMAPETLKRCCSIIALALGKPETEIRASVEELAPAVDEIASVTGVFRLGERVTAAREALESP